MICMRVFIYNNESESTNLLFTAVSWGSVFRPTSDGPTSITTTLWPFTSCTIRLITTTSEPDASVTVSSTSSERLIRLTDLSPISEYLALLKNHNTYEYIHLYTSIQMYIYKLYTYIWTSSNCLVNDYGDFSDITVITLDDSHQIHFKYNWKQKLIFQIDDGFKFSWKQSMNKITYTRKKETKQAATCTCSCTKVTKRY